MAKRAKKQPEVKRKPHPQEVDRFHRRLGEIAASVFGVDPSGDPWIEIKVIDRSRMHRMHYEPVPYLHKAETEEEVEEVGRMIGLNLRVAFEEWNRWDNANKERK